MSRSVSGILRRFPSTRGSKSHRSASRCLLLASLLILASTGASVGPARGEGPENTGPVERSEEALFSLDSPLGPIEYNLGRGLRFGGIGLNIGGFKTYELEKLTGENGEFSIEGINFLVLLQPIQPLRLFMELEVGDLIAVDLHTGDSESSPTVNFQRLFGEVGLNDALNFRLGKFQTPVGRWNLVPAEPFVWTATDPIITESFDEHTTGAMLHGSLFPRRGSLSYWLYGQIHPFDTEADEDPADHSVGGRLEYSADLGAWSIGSSLLASQRDQRWGYVAGLDGQLNFGPFELTSEFVYTWGDPERPFRWDIYVQGVLEVLPHLYMVARYEHSAGLGSDPNLDLSDVGLTWLPVPFLNLKATYRFSFERNEDALEGFKASFTVLF